MSSLTCCHRGEVVAQNDRLCSGRPSAGVVDDQCAGMERKSAVLDLDLVEAVDASSIVSGPARLELEVRLIWHPSLCRRRRRCLCRGLIAEWRSAECRCASGLVAAGEVVGVSTRGVEAFALNGGTAPSRERLIWGEDPRANEAHGGTSGWGAGSEVSKAMAERLMYSVPPWLWQSTRLAPGLAVIRPRWSGMRGLRRRDEGAVLRVARHRQSPHRYSRLAAIHS